MNLTISTIKSIASRNVWSSDWACPFGDAILFYKDDRGRANYHHTHPEWRNNYNQIFKELDISDKAEGYTKPIKITLFRFKSRSFHQALSRKAIYISLGENIILGSKRPGHHMYGEMDKVNSTPSWKSDFYDKKEIWNRYLEDEEFEVVGNMSTSMMYPQTGNMFIEVLYEV